MISSRTRGFTLIELLVVIAIIALLSSIIFAALTTSRAKARDARRLTDLAMVSRAIGVYETGSGTLSYGSSSVVYTSLPDSSSSCASWSLPALQSGWSYRCVAAATLRNTDGTGWIPINFTGTAGDAFVRSLPIDPLNNASGYYTYIPPQNSAQFVLGASKAESPTSNMDVNSTGGFTMGAFSSFAAATGATSTASGGGGGGGGGGGSSNITWNGSRWVATAPTASGGTVGTATTYTGIVSSPRAIAFDGTNMWTANESGSVSKITPDGTVTNYPTGGSSPWGIAYDGSNMWVVNFYGNNITKVTPAGGVSVHPGGAGTNPTGIAFDGTNLWVSDDGGGFGDQVAKITLAGSRTNYSYGSTSKRPAAIAYDGSNMWTADPGGGTQVSRVTPGGSVTSWMGTGNTPNGIAWDGANMWTSNAAGSVTKVASNGAMTTYSGTGATPKGIVFDGANMWTADSGANGVSRISSTGVITKFPGITGGSPYAIAYDGTNVWTANYTGNSVTKIVAR